MNEEGVCYPAFLMGGPDTKPLAFKGPSALFISGRFRPAIGPMGQAILVDASGRSWTLHSVTAVGRWGTWTERLRLWWNRQYRVEYDATEGSAMSLDALKGKLLQRAAASEAALKADTDVDDEVREYFLEGWRQLRQQLGAAETFEGVAEAMGPYRLYTDNWFSGRGRSNRAEYLVVMLSATVIAALAAVMSGFIPSTAGFCIDLVFGSVAPMWLIAAAAARRCHDFGCSFYWLVAVWVLIGAIEEGAPRNLHYAGDPHGWLSIVAWVMSILVLAIPPGTAGENRYDPEPNPGPSL